MLNSVVIIGAPRSGTNMLRDVLCTFSGIATWPCDEINYIWRHGNVGYESDEFTSDMATNGIKKYIRSRFQWVERKYSAKIVVEKTCANCLRIPFVAKVLPDAKYIYIYRDGIDATGSAKLRWTANLDIKYILQKARFVPFLDLPFYAFRYMISRIYRLVSRDRRVKSWGPRLDGMEDLVRNHNLNEVCAIQWQRCVDSADASLKTLPQDKVLRVRYEDFVSKPARELKKIMAFLEYDVPDPDLEKAVSGVSSRSVGKGRKALSDSEIRHLEKLVFSSLRRYEYL